MKKNLRIVQKITYPDVEDPSELTIHTLGSNHAGLNHICCNGKVTIGSDLGMFVINFCLTNLVATVFCWKVTEYLKHRSFFISIEIVVTFFIDLLLNLTAFVNPGIIKRFPLKEIMTLVPENKGKLFPSKKYIKFKGHRIESKLCRSDIGLRNYRFFYLYLVITLCGCLFTTIFCIISIKNKYHSIKADSGMENFQKTISQVYYSFIIAFITLMFSIQLLFLVFLHTYLISKNITTHEYYLSYFDEVNPFDLGIKNNWKEVFCSRIPKINFPYSATITNFELTNLETAKKNRETRKKHGLKPKKGNPPYVYKPESTDEEQLDHQNKSGDLFMKSENEKDNDNDNDNDDIELEINLSKNNLNSKELQNLNKKARNKTLHSSTSSSLSSDDND
ncbi:s-acyltransferase [Anaeramoeba flamelloides]|uniref:Palmitoyltransferase n=1 Tax=Anaeramoeba flamelloides TaxID=1746091 RepID=A0ABQ8Z9C4_9EUKA|nr:s-acyltransferase [Anaeramoeba flamelloides]